MDILTFVAEFLTFCKGNVNHNTFSLFKFYATPRHYL